MNDIGPTLAVVALGVVGSLATACGIAIGYGANALVGALLLAGNVGCIVYAWCRA